MTTIWIHHSSGVIAGTASQYISQWLTIMCIHSVHAWCDKILNPESSSICIIWVASEFFPYWLPHISQWPLYALHTKLDKECTGCKATKCIGDDPEGYEDCLGASCMSDLYSEVAILMHLLVLVSQHCQVGDHQHGGEPCAKWIYALCTRWALCICLICLCFLAQGELK